MTILSAICMVLLVAACGGFAGDGSGQSLVGRQIVPVDQGAADSSFAEFREELLKAARAADLPQVLTLMSPTVKYNENLTVGNLAEFKREWEVDSRPERFLHALIDVLILGGRFDQEGNFVAPWTFTEFPGSAWEMVTHIVVIRPSVPVFAEPRETAKLLARVSYTIFEKETGPDGWNVVVLADGRRGYVGDSDIREPSGPRAYFRKIDGQWKLVVFAAGAA